MKKTTKILFLRACKQLGFFNIARRLTSQGLRILCYHNFSDTDEIAWKPGMFITPGTLRKRLDYLKSKQFPVLDLAQAVELYKQGHLPSFATVITIDDGWYPTKLFAHPLLQEKLFPYTVYVTSLPSINVVPVLNHVINYFFWKTKKLTIDLNDLGCKLSGERNFKNQKDCDKVAIELVKFVRQNLNDTQGQEFVQKLSKLVGVDYSEIVQRGILSHLSAEEIKGMAKEGVDIQLHTHTHFWRDNDDEARKEIQENRAFLEPLVGKKLHHFCYPSGNWRKRQFPLLESLNIESATTTISGLNYPGGHLLALKRYVDGEGKKQIEFEAEMSGFVELWSRIGRKRQLQNC